MELERHCLLLVVAIILAVESELLELNDDVKVGILNLHNDIRAGYQEIQYLEKENVQRLYPTDMKRLVWNAEAERQAEKHIETCIFAHEGDGIISRELKDGTICGQNLAIRFTGNDWTRVIEAWMKEQLKFIYGLPGHFELFAHGHYTQVVWAKTCSIGCAVASCDGNFLYACNYCQMGNLMGSEHFPFEMSLIPEEHCSQCSSTCPCEEGLCTCSEGECVIKGQPVAKPEKLKIANDLEELAEQNNADEIGKTNVKPDQISGSASSDTSSSGLDGSDEAGGEELEGTEIDFSGKDPNKTPREESRFSYANLLKRLGANDDGNTFVIDNREGAEGVDVIGKCKDD